MTIPNPRIDPILYPDDGTVGLRIRGWEKVLNVGATLVEHGLAAKRHLTSEPKQCTDAPLRGVS